MTVVVDDHILMDLLAGTSSPNLRETIQGEAVYTTGCWYYRLARALLAGSGAGSLSGRLSGLGDDERRDILEAMRRLPPTIGLLSLRMLVPVMSVLRVTRPLNMVNAEALAVALVLDGRVLVSVESELLRSGANDLELSYGVVR